MIAPVAIVTTGRDGTRFLTVFGGPTGSEPLEFRVERRLPLAWGWQPFVRWRALRRDQ